MSNPVKQSSGTEKNYAPNSRWFDTFDSILAVFLIASCAYFIFLSNQLPAPASFLGEIVLPGNFPRLILYTIAILSLLLPFEHRFSPDSWPSIRKSRSAPIGWITWLTAAFIGGIVVLGPVIGTVLMVFGTTLLLPMLWGEKRVWLVVIYALLFTAIITYLFSLLVSPEFSRRRFATVALCQGLGDRQ